MKTVTVNLLIGLLSASTSLLAQTEPPAMDHSQHGASTPVIDEKKLDHSQHQSNEVKKPSPSMDHAQHNAKPAEDSSVLRDPHAYSGGYDFGPLGQMTLADSMNFSSIMVDHLEVMSMGDEVSYGYGLKGWWGRDFNRLLVKSNGEASDDEIDELALELLWGHAIAPYWNSTLGTRADTDGETERYALELGISGLAPYWFEIDAALYLDTDGRMAFRGSAEYELLITQKLILQPMVETTVFSRSDKTREVGGGLSEVSTALRLRYEVRREFAPYLGIEWQKLFGSTADYARTADEHASELNAVAGLRLMF